LISPWSKKLPNGTIFYASLELNKTKQSDKQEEQVKEIDNKLEDDFNFDEDDEAVFRQFRERRLAEFQLLQGQAYFGDVRDIAGQDFVQEVNKAGENIWVILHLYKAGIPLCSLINNHLNLLAPKFRKTKFLKSVSNLCIPNFPDDNLPAIFIYQNGSCKKQLIGPNVFGGMNLQVDELEWMLGKAGAVETDIEENPRKHWGAKSNMIMSNVSDSEDEF